MILHNIELFIDRNFRPFVKFRSSFELPLLFVIIEKEIFHEMVM